MAPQALAASVIAGLLVTACDVSQKKPETSSGVFLRQAVQSEGVQAPARAIPGVSRDRQIRV